MIAEDFSTASAQLSGTVLAVQANFYRVQLDEVLEGGNWGIGELGNGELGNKGITGKTEFITPSPPLLLCTRRTRLKKIGQQVMVGDRVIVEEPDWVGGRGAIAEVLPRSSELDRPAIANVNQILLVFAVADPTIEPFQLSRFLVKAESTGLDVVLCFNKSDLISTQEQEEISDRLKHWGYNPVFISVYKNINIDLVSEQLKDKITVVAGASGVGKSSLINKLIPTVNLRVGEVSGKLARGRHTTRHVELFELPEGGLLADTPGFNQPDLNCTPEELANYFPEARAKLKNDSCRFSNCLHRDEPGCVVSGDWERYEHYLEFLEEVVARQIYLKEQSDPESTTKVKNKKGKQQYEPKLETKKYRQKSRRTQLQELREMFDESDE